MPSPPLRRLTPADAVAYRALLLAAYADAPAAFTATVAEREALPLDWWAARLSDAPDAAKRVFGAFAGARLVGAAGLRLLRRPRTRHKAVLFGMAVAPDAQRRGLGRALVGAVLAEAEAAGVRLVQLQVTAPNAAARRLYAACGFRPYGTEPFALAMDGGFVDVVHLWRPVGTEDEGI